VFTARYVLIPYKKQITFRLYKVNIDACYSTERYDKLPVAQLKKLPANRTRSFSNVFDVHGPVHVGKIYVQLKVLLDVLFYLFFIILYS
jgi:hypothetical protein